MKKIAEKHEYKTVAARAVSFLWLGTIVTSALALATQILLARFFGPSEFGELFAALIAINLIGPFIAFGVPTFWLRAFAEEGAIASRWLGASYSLVGIRSIIISGALAIWGLTSNNENTAFPLLTILAPLAITQGAIYLVSASLQLQGKYACLALWDSAQSVSRFIFVAIYISLFGRQTTQIDIAEAYLSIGIIIIAASSGYLAIFRKNKISSSSTQIHSVKSPSQFSVLQRSWKYGVEGVLYIIYYQVDVVILKHIAGEAEAGLYGAAYLVVGATYTLPGVIFQKYLLPQLHEWQFSDPKKLLTVLRKGTLLMGVLGCAACVCVLLIAKFALVEIFGQAYSSAVPLLEVLALAVPLRFASTSAAAVLVSESLFAKKTYFMAAATVANIVVNICVIPKYGAMGAAWATVMTEAFMLLSVMFIASRNLGKNAVQSEGRR